MKKWRWKNTWLPEIGRSSIRHPIGNSTTQRSNPPTKPRDGDHSPLRFDHAKHVYAGSTDGVQQHKFDLLVIDQRSNKICIDPIIRSGSAEP